MRIFELATKLVRTNNKESLERLISENPSVMKMEDILGWSLIHYAVNEKNINMASFLIQKGIDINSKDNDDQTPLHLAVIRDHFELIKLLVDNGADVNIKSKCSGLTALHRALYVRNINTKIVEYLLLFGNADIYAEDINEKTALDYITDEKIKNELLFIYKNREKILKEIKNHIRS